MTLRNRFKRLAANSWEAWVAALAIETAIAFLFNPEALADSAIGQTLHPWDYAWTIGYGLAGVFMLFGLLAPANKQAVGARVELAGLTLFTMGASIQVLAAVALAGLSASVSIGVLLGAIAAAVGRMWALSHPQDPVIYVTPKAV